MLSEVTSVARTPRYRRGDAARYLLEKHDVRCSERTLAKLAVIGGGPVLVYIGRYPFYPEDGLDAYAKSKISPRPSAAHPSAALLRGVVG
jgi:hypothetical protein